MSQDRKQAVGVVKPRSVDQIDSMRDAILDAETQIEPSADDAPIPPPKKTAALTPDGKKRRNHRINIDYFGALDDIIAESFHKQKAAYDIVKAFTQMMESRGIEGLFSDEQFETAASNMATIAMVKQMGWLMGLGPEHTDRIVENTIDRLFPAGIPRKG